MKRLTVMAFTFALILPATPILAKAATSAGATTTEQPVPKETRSVTRHSVTIDGETIKYTTTAGTLLLYDAKHQPTASVFYIAYAEDGADPDHRPLTFAYNGGPGFASALVDIGGFGPERIVWPAPGDAKTAQPPYRLVPKQYSQEHRPGVH